ncbi:MAG: pyridoxamine kinase [Clostridia bacterium]|nr:pyridoxamine kinase [Clostridia bacterium]
MAKQPIKRVAALHDLSAFGRCALTVVIPALSAMGVQVLPVPTALLSTHTGGFDGYYFRDMSDSIEPIADHWESLGIRPDSVYTGFLSGEAQCEIIERFIRRFRSADTLTLIDPVFGDDGELYSACTEALVERMRHLCSLGDVIVPNLTEACMLCGMPYLDTAAMQPAELNTYVAELLYKLADFGPRRVAITGIVTDRSCNVATAGLDLGAKSLDKTPFSVNLHREGGSYPGTGDLFASVLLGKLLGGAAFPASVAAASAFVRDVITVSEKYDTPHREGVALEPCLYKLAQL